MNYKQIIVVRTDLKMSPGKMAAQVAHASLSAAEEAAARWQDWYRAWKAEGQKKVVVKAASEDEIIELYNRARAGDVPCYIVNDAGLTELPPGTTTTLGIGPGPNEVIDRFTGHLKLL
ncbi:MAG: peptidyl-tRNA hydrolase [Methanobacteriota archaeon]|nr:MAG: peptidyl-tRNA hydrolase [Euryarchaeota archaeon]